MKKSILNLLFLCFTSIFWGQTNPTIEWLNTMGSMDSERAYALTTDNQNDVIVTGNFHNTVDFDPGTGELNLTSNGNEDIFIQKLDSDGNLIWAKQIGGSNNDSGVSVATDPNDNIYVTGWFSTTVDFDPGPNNFDMTSLGSWDIFILKLDSDGNFVWVKQLGSTTLDYAAGLVLDSADNIYLTGMFKKTIDFDPGFNGFNMTPDSWDVFVLKLDVDGNFQWAQKFGGASYDKARGIAIDPNDNIYIGGQFKQTVDFDNSNAVHELTSIGLYDAFVLKLDPDGNYIWAKQFGGTQDEDVIGLISDADENVYVTGYFKDTVDFDPGTGVFNINSGGGEDTFLVKLNNNGDLSWANSLNGTSDNRGFSLALGQNNQVYVAGFFKETIVISWASGFASFTSNGESDAYIASANISDGVFKTFIQKGGTGYDYAYHIHINPPNELYVSGAYSDTVNFSDLPDDTTFEQTAVGDKDAFVMKLNIETNSIWSDQFSGLKIYPNPAKENIFIDFGKNITANIKLYDTYGRLIYDISPATTKLINIQLPVVKGIYFLEVEIHQNSKRFKVLIQ